MAEFIQAVESYSPLVHHGGRHNVSICNLSVVEARRECRRTALDEVGCGEVLVVVVVPQHESLLSELDVSSRNKCVLVIGSAGIVIVQPNQRVRSWRGR